jgi:hypothetical protein
MAKSKETYLKIAETFQKKIIRNISLDGKTSKKGDITVQVVSFLSFLFIE